MADEQLFEGLPEQERHRPKGAAHVRLRVPERSQIGMQVAALDDLISEIIRYAQFGRSSRASICRRCTTSSRRARASPDIASSAGTDVGALAMGHGRWGRQRPPTGPAVSRSSGLSLVMRRGVDELSQPVELPGRPYGVLERLLAQGVASMVQAGLVSVDTLAQDGLRVRAGAGASSFRRRPRLGELHAAAQVRVERLRAEVETDPAQAIVASAAAKERGARERAARIAAAQERMKEWRPSGNGERRPTRKRWQSRRSRRASTNRCRRAGDEDGRWRMAPRLQHAIISAPEQQVIVAVDIDTSGSDRGLAQPDRDRAC